MTGVQTCALPIYKDEVGLLYALATTWAGWIQAHRDDWSAVADLPKVNACMKQVVQMDVNYDNGGPHLYLGLMNSRSEERRVGKECRSRWSPYH